MQVYDTGFGRFGRFKALAAGLVLFASTLSGGAATAAPPRLEVTGSAVQQESLAQARELFRQALAAARESRWTDARTLAEQGLELAPDDADGSNLLGEILERLGEPGGARAAYEAASRADPQWPIPVRNLARMLLAQENYREALPVIDRAIALQPQVPELRAWSGVAHRANGSLAQARAAFESAWEIDPSSMELAVDVSVARMDSGDSAGALAAARRATEIAPNHPGPWMLLGDLLAESTSVGDKARAPAAYRKAIAANQAGPIPYMRLANAYSELSLHAESEAALRRAMELGATGARVWLMLARSIVNQSRPADAIEFYTRVIEEVPDGAEAYLERGEALFNSNRHEEAIADVRRAIELAPGASPALLTGARILMVMGRLDEAIELSQDAVGSGGTPVLSNLALGRLLVRAGRSAEAIAPLELVLRLAPEASEARYLLGQSLLATGETERGQQMLSEYQEMLREQRDAEARELQQDVADRARVHVVRARVFIGEERFAEARQQLEAAVDLNPEILDAWELLVETYDRLGLADEAAEARRKVEELRSGA